MSNAYTFSDRTEAGRMLAEKVAAKHYRDPVVFALPRGGVPVAAEVAQALNAPLDLVLVRKIGVPYQPELALAAVVDGRHPEVVVNEEVRRIAHVSDEQFEALKAHELAEIERRRGAYLRGRDRVAIAGTIAIVVDDGIATGATVRAALRGLRRGNPRKLVLAVPVAPAETLEDLRREVDDIICLQTPEPFYAIGVFYRDFAQMSDQEVVDILARTAAGRGPDPAAAS